jgi:hypothetical protein
VRTGTRVKQKTLLNLGKYFDLDPTHWHLLTARIDQIIHGEQHQDTLVSEPKTLATMPTRLSSASGLKGSIVVLDAGITSQDNLDWLKEHSYRYIVVSRERYKERPELNDGAVIVKDKTADQVMAKQLEGPDTGEIRLYCHSEKREKKDQAIRTQFNRRFEEKLNVLNEGLSKKRTTKQLEKIYERVGRLKEKHTKISSDYDIEIESAKEKNMPPRSYGNASKAGTKKTLWRMCIAYEQILTRCRNKIFGKRTRC